MLRRESKKNIKEREESGIIMIMQVNRKLLQREREKKNPKNCKKKGNQKKLRIGRREILENIKD